MVLGVKRTNRERSELIKKGLKDLPEEDRQQARRIMRYDVVTLARRHSKKAIETLVAAMDDVDAAWSSRIKAAKTILERGYGKPQAVVHHAHHYDDSTLEDMARQILEKRGLSAPRVIDAGGSGSEE